MIEYGITEYCQRKEAHDVHRILVTRDMLWKFTPWDGGGAKGSDSAKEGS